jgi:glycosyltransferase involved in cell wall biosynthesis
VKGRILQVTKAGGGVGQYVLNLTEGLGEQGYYVKVACLSEGHLMQQLERRGIPCQAIPMTRYQLDPLSDMQAFVRLRDLISRDNFDLVHAHTSKPGFLGRVAAKMSGLPAVYTPHCFSFHDQAPRNRRVFFLMLERLAGRFFTDLVIAIADWEHQLAIQAGVVPPDRVVTVHTGVPLSSCAPTMDRSQVRQELGAKKHSFLVGMIARMTLPKSPQDAVRAMTHVKDNVQLLLVGDGPLMDDVEHLVSSLELEERVLLTGWRPDVLTILHCLNAFLLSSYWEGFSLTILEAMACGLPVVATDTHGTREQVQHGISGYLVPPREPKALGQAIQRLAADPNAARAMGQAGRKRLEEEFTLERMLSGITQAYERFLHNGSA